MYITIAKSISTIRSNTIGFLYEKQNKLSRQLKSDTLDLGKYSTKNTTMHTLDYQKTALKTVLQAIQNGKIVKSTIATFT